MLCAVTIIDRISQALTNGPATVVVEPPGTGTGFWAGGPSVVTTTVSSTSPTGCAGR